MNISKITVAQLASLAQESEQVDPIDWGELSIDEEHAYLLMANHMLEQFGNTDDDKINYNYLTLLATCVKLSVENFTLNLKLLGKK